MTERLSADGIEAHVKTLVGALVDNQPKKLTPHQAIIVDASVALIVNFLINLNDIAYAANETYYDKVRSGQ